MLKVVVNNDIDKKLRLARSERFACQSVARKALPNERVSKCMRMLTQTAGVEVWKHLKTDKAFYNGLAVCGSVWHCPVCASKISERRRKELKTAYDKHIENGGKVALLTLTFSHKKTDRLKDTLKKFSEATTKFMSGKRYNNIRKIMGIVGRIRAFEITYGENGFHPHTHTAIFYENECDLAFIQREMFQLWEKACQKVGLDTKEKYGLSLENGEKANDYLSKHGTGNWGLDQELTKSHIKKAKQNSMTPFDFLRKVLETGESEYLKLFKEYAEAMKGKRQLQWSQGLKAKFIIEEKTDEEIAKEKIEDAQLLGYIDLEQWKFILKHDNRSILLDYVEKYDFETACEFLLKSTKKITSQKIEKSKENI